MGNSLVIDFRHCGVMGLTWPRKTGHFKNVDLVIEPNQEMKRSRFSEEKKVRILQELRNGKSRKEIMAEHNVSSQTISNWKQKYGEMDVNEARKLKALTEENARMKRIIADLTMQNDILKEVNSKKW